MGWAGMFWLSAIFVGFGISVVKKGKLSRRCELACGIVCFLLLLAATAVVDYKVLLAENLCVLFK